MRTGTATPSPAKPARRRVVDAPVRVFHGLFALSFVGAYLTAEGERLRLLHVTLGYTMAGLLVFRLLYGLLGPRQARLVVLWHKLAGLWPWACALQVAVHTQTAVAARWRQGQNLFLALSIGAVLGLALPLTVSGYAAYNAWGDVLGGDWISEVHAFLGNTLLVVVLAHIAAIVGLSVLRRKNLAAPMVSGCVDGPGPDLVRHNHAGLAAVLLCAVLAYGAWEWQQSPQGLVPVQAANVEAQGDRTHAQ